MKQKLSREEISSFSLELSLLLHAGVTVGDALALLADESGPDYHDLLDPMAQAVDAVNIIAPEHLELHVAGAMDLLGSIRNAGAIFLGAWTPEAVGDYVAGPNHTLPTGGTARWTSPLSTNDFVKKSSIIQYTPAALARDGEAVRTIATHEGLWAHARSVELRMAELENLAGAAARQVEASHE